MILKASKLREDLAFSGTECLLVVQPPSTCFFDLGNFIALGEDVQNRIVPLCKLEVKDWENWGA